MDWGEIVLRILLTFALGVLIPAFTSHNVFAADSNIGETTEIKFNATDAPDLLSKATALGSPVRIFEYVRNGYDYSLYQGARSGSINTYLGGRGNDVDLAATLIAMLRSQGIPARYAVGTVRAPSPQVMNWLGVENVDLAYAILRNQGIQSVALSADKSTIDFEHVWVEALVPYASYRGAGSNAANCATTPAACNWAPLDPSFKQHAQRTSNLDPYNNTVNGIAATGASPELNYTNYYNALKNNDPALRDKNPLEIYQEQTLSWLRTNAPGKTLEDISDFQGIVIEQDGLLPASLPYILASTVRRYNSAADHDLATPAPELKKWTKFVTVMPYFNGSPSPFGGASIDLATVSTKRLTYSFSPNAAATMFTQTFRLDGVTLGGTLMSSVGSIINNVAIGPGAPLTLHVTMDGTPAPDATADHTIVADYKGTIGGYYLIAAGGETSNWSQAHRAAGQLLAANQQYPIYRNANEVGCQISTGMSCTPYTDASFTTKLLNNPPALDALTGGLLSVAAAQYYARLKDDFAQTDKLNKIKTPIAGFLGVVSSTYEAEYIDGTAFSVLPGGLLIDMKGITLGGAWRIDQPAAFSNRQFEFDGHIMSSLEHETWQQLTGYDAVSTVRGIQMALADTTTKLVTAKKNSTIDTMDLAYADLGFTKGAAPAGFGKVQFNLFGTQPATWTNATNLAAFDTMQAQETTATSALRQNRSNYVYSTGSGLYAWTNCVNSQASQLATWIAQGLGNYTASFYFCDGSYHTGTVYNVQSQLQTFYQGTVVPGYIGQGYFDYFDVVKGFSDIAGIYRATPIAGNAQFTSYVQKIRDNVYLQDPTKFWVEYVLPSKQTVSPNSTNYKFAVDIRKAYDTPSGNLVSATFEILNNTGIAAGGGYVPAGGKVLTQATSIATSTSTTVLTTFNNAVLTDKNTIAEANNNLIKTASTADPVSTVTGNNYHDETDIFIRGKAGLDYAFTRTYNSTSSSTRIDRGLGFGWTHSYAMMLKSNDYGNCPNCTTAQAAENGNNLTSSITYTDERGGDHNYLVSEVAPNAVTAPQGEFDKLELNIPQAGQNTLTFRNGTRYVFENIIGTALAPTTSLKTAINVTSRLKQIIDPWNNQINFAYDAAGRLSTVTDNMGVNGTTGLVFTYDVTNHLSNIADWTGRNWGYIVNPVSGNLTSYTNPLAQTLSYTYTGTHNLNQIQKPLRGVQTAFSYYQNGRTYNYADKLGNTETLDYDLYRKTTRVTDPRGGIREYEYDPSGRLTKLSEPDGAILLFGNNADGLRNTKTDGLGYKTQYSYKSDKSFNTASDTFGNVTREQDPLNLTVDTTYGIYDQRASVKDKRNIVSTTSFHTVNGTCGLAGKPDTVTLLSLSGISNVKLRSYCWNSDGTVKSITDYLDAAATKTRTTTPTYDAAHLNVLSVTASGSDGASATKSFTYDALGRKKTETLNRRTSPTNAAQVSLTTSYDYDLLGRVIRVTDAMGNSMQTVYDANGQVFQVIGNYVSGGTRILSTRSYDSADRLIADTDVLGNAINMTYDPAGNVLSITDRENHTSRFEYDAMNRRTAATDPNGYRSTTVYDLAGHPTATTNGANETTLYQYDNLGRLTQITDPMNFTTQYSYDANNNRTCAIDANAMANLQPKNIDGCTVSTTYDELDRPIQSRDAQNKITSTAYDLQGNVTSVTDASNKITAMSYDGLGRLIRVTDPLNKSTTYARDEAGNAWQATNRLGQVTQTTFDNLNRPNTVSYLADNITEYYYYDAYGNLVYIYNPYDPVLGYYYFYFGYDTKNRLTSKTDSRGRGMSFTYDKTDNMLTKTDYQNDVTQFKYDSANHRVAMRNAAYVEASYQHDGAGRVLSRILSNGAQTQYAYNKDGQLTGIKSVAGNGAVLDNISYTRDRAGNILTQSGSNSGNATYVYDPLYRLISANYLFSTQYSTGNSESYTYDAVGNRLTQTLNGIAHAYEYWPTSNRVKAVHAGTIGGAIEKSFTYDSEGRLTTQTGTGAKTLAWDQRNRAKTINNVSYVYDPNNYRIGQRNGAQGNRDYYLEGEHLEAEYSGANLQAKYFRGLSTDELVAGYGWVNGKWTPEVFHHDALMSVTGITAPDGTTLNTASYSAFGDRTVAGTGSSTNRLTYTGREKDSDSGLYYYRARYYDASIGRFISEDPLGFVGSGVNWYAYVNNNPVNGNDPSGLRPPTDGETGDLLSPIFNDKVDYAKIDIQNGANWNPIAWIALTIMGRPAITLGNTIHFSNNHYQPDFSAGIVSVSDQSILPHETTHVWQNQQNGFITTAIGSVVDNLAAGNDGYRYSLSPSLGQAGPPKPFSLYGVEQQAAIVQDYSSLTHDAQSELNIFPTSSNPDAISQYQNTLGTAGLAVGSGAAGSYVLYPNKINSNQLQPYRKPH